MNSTTRFLWVLGLAFGFGLLSCTKNTDAGPDQVQAHIEDILLSGLWKITRFEDSGKDELSHFRNYDFIFTSNNAIVADNGMNSLEGSWSIMDQSSSDDSLNDLDLILHFSEPVDFEELNEDWEFISYSQSSIELKHVSGGNGGTDYLTFEKK